MGKIHKLSPQLADMIAAGEVVERPASVIKELVENAIDAGAKKITVEIKNGGVTFMRVADDGCGISREDAPTAFLRHATSKISTAEDLGGIATMGFRGEALAAISAVSRIDLLTRAEGEELGTSIRVEAGNVLDVSPAGCPQGTTMIVRDLFYNTPARMKFMKKDSVEGSFISGAVQRQALGHPEIAFRFIREGKPELSTPGDGRLLSAIYAAMGRSAAKDMVEVKYEAAGVRLTGYVGKPTASRGSRSFQHFFVNGRYVKSRMLASALEEAYKNQLMTNRFPICVLHLTVLPTAVDVNVHPAKTEVKFLREGDVFDAVHYGVLGALSRATDKPEMTLPKPQQSFFKSMTAQEYRNMTGFLEKSSQVSPQRELTAAMAQLQKQSERREAQGIVHDSAVSVPQVSDARGNGFAEQKNMPRSPVTPPVVQEQTPTPEKPKVSEPPKTRESFLRWEQPDVQKVPEPVVVPKVPEEMPVSAVPEPEEAPVTEQTAMELPKVPLPVMPEKPPEQQPKKPDALPYRIIGEALDTYIIVEQGEGLLLIDKHAAHERILFEKLKKQRREIMSQMLLSPLHLTLAREEMAVLLNSGSIMERLGFQLEDFGGDTLVVRALPAEIAPQDAPGTLEELAQALITGKKLDENTVFDELLHTVACKAAIKGGRKTDPKEISALVAELMGRDDIKYCPHGRPVCISLSKNTLERQFKRQV